MIRRLILVFVAGCAARPPSTVPATPSPPLPVHGVVAQDTSPKEGLRMVPPEVYLRTYLRLFGALTPIDVQNRARGGDGRTLFGTWNDYISALGLPDYRLDIPRQTQTNALMVATFERLGVALCDRAVEHDLRAPKGSAPAPPDEKAIFAFDLPEGEIDEHAFGPRFDVLHRTFLGYPASLAPPERVERFYRLYRETAQTHTNADPHSRFSPGEAGWAAVCYGLVRHPEFHLY